MPQTPLAVVFGCAGPVLSDQEAQFFRDANPLGFILFGRNCVDPVQLAKLVFDLRNCLQREGAPILIDQEGGRVARLRPPHWPEYPSARVLGDLAKTSVEVAIEAVRLCNMLIGLDLIALGITVDCAPTIDVPVPGAHEMIGTRAYSTDAQLVTELGTAACEGLLAANVMPVIKHLPGYGRAFVDSHHALPVISESLDELDASDFVPFKALAHMPWGMTAHTLLTAVDLEHPATFSAKIIEQVIRKRIGFKGILITDDLSMNALAGDIDERAAATLRAGCDLVLHCNGKLDEMISVASAVGALSSRLLDALKLSEGRRAEADRTKIDVMQARRRLLELMTS